MIAAVITSLLIAYLALSTAAIVAAALLIRWVWREFRRKS